MLNYRQFLGIHQIDLHKIYLFTGYDHFSLSNNDFTEWLRYESNPFLQQFVETKEEFTSCKEHIKSLENLYDLMKKKGEKREDIIAQQYLTL